MKWWMMSIAVLGMTFMVGCDNDDKTTARADRSDTEWREARRDRDGAYGYTGDRMEQDRMRQDRMQQNQATGERRAAPMSGERWTVEGSSGEAAAQQGQTQQQNQQPQRQNRQQNQQQSQDQQDRQQNQPNQDTQDQAAPQPPNN